MATETKEKLIRVLQLMQTTDEKTPMNATQIVEKLSTEYELEGVNRKSIYRDIASIIILICQSANACVFIYQPLRLSSVCTMSYPQS